MLTRHGRANTKGWRVLAECRSHGVRFPVLPPSAPPNTNTNQTTQTPNCQPSVFLAVVPTDMGFSEGARFSHGNSWNHFMGQTETQPLPVTPSNPTSPSSPGTPFFLGLLSMELFRLPLCSSHSHFTECHQVALTWHQFHLLGSQ